MGNPKTQKMTSGSRSASRKRAVRSWEKGRNVVITQMPSGEGDEDVLKARVSSTQAH